MNTSTTPAAQSIVIGMVATYGIGSDSYSGTVVKVSPSGHKVTFKFSGFGGQRIFTRRADGRYRPANSRCGYLSLGVARDYMDPSF